MIETKKKMVEQEYQSDVICDICGKSCKDGIDMNFEFMTLSADWGYASGFDTESWRAEVCIKCVVKKLKPIVKFRVDSYI